MEHFFQIRIQWLCAVLKHVLDSLLNEYRDLVTNIDVLRLRPKLREFSDAVYEKTAGKGISDVVCLVDGKFHRTCRPTNRYGRDYQRSVYNGHYRGHGLKIQSVLWIDGMLNLYVDSARLHDSPLLDTSRLLQQMELMFIDGNPLRPAKMYGDPAYWGEGVHLARKCKGVFRSPVQSEKDTAMTPVREMVEHSFAKCVKLWSYMDFSKKHMLWSACKDDEWIIAAFL